MRNELKIFVGFDSREPIAFHVLSHSILRRSTVPVTIVPLARNLLNGIYTRERGPTEATEFSLTRFLVPYLSGFQGYSIFIDSDMLCLADIAELWPMIMRSHGAVLLCKHNYIPKGSTKFLGQPQVSYPRKNWSSFTVFKNQMCYKLTPGYVNHASGPELQRLEWLEDFEIGELPLEWNWLVSEYLHNDAAKIVHFTNGGPWFGEYRDCDYADLWWEELDRMTHPLLPGGLKLCHERREMASQNPFAPSATR